MQEETPLISVLMTSYNREKYIALAIESVLASTYKNFELIVVDDRSKDKTVEISRQYAKKDARVKVYVNEQNLGDYPNRNKAASYARGKYIKYVDADDLIYPFGLAQLVFYMEQFPAAGYGLCSLAQDKTAIFPFQLSPHEAYKYHYFGPGLFHKAPLSSIIRKDVFDRVNGFKKERMVGDFEMWHRLSLQEHVVLMPQGIVWYREHDEQEMLSYRENPFESFTYKLIAKKYLLSADCPLKSQERKQAIKKIDYLQSTFILSALKKRKLNLVKELSRKADINLLQAFFHYLK